VRGANPVGEKDEGGDCQVEACREDGRRTHPDERKKEEPRGSRACHRSEGVQGVELANLLAQGVEPCHAELAEDRERRSHESRGDEEDPGRERQLDKARREGREPLEHWEKSRDDEGRYADPGLEQAIEGKRPGVPVSQFSEEVRA
jgi:hypothetical protein